MKIFVIGFNKTATTTFHNIFLKEDITSRHGWGWLRFIDDFDAFSDGHHVNIFKTYYEKYPDALFILNTRGIRGWLISRYKHGYNKRVVAENLTSTWWPPSLEKTKNWIETRNKHFVDVLKFFEDKPKSLFIIDIEKNRWIEFLYKILGKEYNESKKIRSNKTNKVIPDDILEDINEKVLMGLKEMNYNEELFNDNLLNIYDDDKEIKRLTGLYENNFD